MKRIFTIAVVALGMLAANSVSAQKIAVVSADEIFSSMKETKKADTALAQFQQTMQEDMANMESELNEALAKFVKDSGTMTASVKEAKRTTLQGRIQDFQKKQEEMNQLMEAEKEKQIAPIREKMKKTIEIVAKENGYTYVMYKEQMIVFPEADDISAKVKARLGSK